MQKPIVQEIVDFITSLYIEAPKDCPYVQEIAPYCNIDIFSDASIAFYKNLNFILEAMAKESRLSEFHAELKVIISQVYRILAFETMHMEKPLHENRYTLTEKHIRQDCFLYYSRTKLGLFLILLWCLKVVGLIFDICSSLAIGSHISADTISRIEGLWWAALLGWLLFRALASSTVKASAGNEVLIQASSEYLFWGEISTRRYQKINFGDIKKVIRGRGMVICILHSGGTFLIKKDSFSVGNFTEFMELITRYRPRPIPIVIKELRK